MYQLFNQIQRCNNVCAAGLFREQAYTHSYIGLRNLTFAFGVNNVYYIWIKSNFSLFILDRYYDELSSKQTVPSDVLDIFITMQARSKTKYGKVSTRLNPVRKRRNSATPIIRNDHTLTY